MYCRKCGAKNEEDATNCYSCGQALLSFQAYQQQMAQRQNPRQPNNQQLNNQQPSNQQPINQQQNYQQQNYQQRPYYAPNTVPNYLVWSILATAFCCLIPGIVSIVYSSQVNTKLASGDYYGAVDASNTAKKWAWASFILGALAIIPYMIMIVLGIASDVR